MRILIVEDEFNIADAIKSRLIKEKYEVDIVMDGEEGLYNASTGIYDLIILDVMLPYMDGFTVLKKLREQDINTKIIMLTAKSMLDDKLNGFDKGADDYVTKPFHMDELLARVNAHLKNKNGFKKDVVEFEDLSLSIKNSKLTCNDNTVELVKKEFLLLEFFISNPNQKISKEQLYEKIWGIDNEIESNNLEVYLTFIRRKLKAIQSSVVIKSVRGLGYRMEYVNEKIAN